MDLIGYHCIQSLSESCFKIGNAKDMGIVLCVPGFDKGWLAEAGESDHLSCLAAEEDPRKNGFEDIWMATFNHQREGKRVCDDEFLSSEVGEGDECTTW